MITVIPADDVLAGRADTALAEGARHSGFLMLSGADDALALAVPRQGLLALFGPDERPRMQMLRNKYDPARQNVYRGFFPSEPENGVMSEGVDIGPDVADAARCGDGADPLTEPTPMPDLPGWRDAAAAYYRELERLGRAVVAGLLRGLGVDAARWERLFDRSISTLRVLHYQARAAEVLPAGRAIETTRGKTWVITRPHTDSGFVTLLWQDPAGGLQAQAPDGVWTDVPPIPGALAVNFGQMLGEWTGGRVRATPHRVLGGLNERFSIPFFFEPAVDALIEPLFPENGGDSFIYGDFLWSRMVKFPNFHGVVRQPAGSGSGQ